MLKYVMMFLIFLLTTRLSFSQEDYPKKVIIDKDTVCAITIPQLDSINTFIVDLDECRELKDSLNSELSTYAKLVSGQKDVIASQEKEINIQKGIVAEKDVIIDSDTKLLKKNNRQVQWLKIQRTVFGGIAIITTSIIIYEQIKK